MEWLEKDLEEFCIKAIELLNTKLGLSLKFDSCNLFKNSAGSNFHIYYYNNFDEQCHGFARNGNILQEQTINLDIIAGTQNITDLKLKIALRIAYAIQRDCKNYMEKK